MKTLTRALAVMALASTNLSAFAQANDWIIAPSTRIRFNTGTAAVSSLPGTNAIPACGAGSGYDYLKQATVLSDASGAGMAFINSCGIYSPTGTAIGSGTGTYQNVFVVPGICKRYFSVQWENFWGPPHFNGLVLHQLDATTPTAITEVGSANLIYDGYSHTGDVAVAPLAADGTRKIYVADGTALKVMTVTASGGYTGLTTLLTLPAAVDARTRMEVSPDGKKVLMVHLGNFASAYDVTSNTISTIGSFGSGTVISGIEYVPYSGGDRYYFSYHTYAGTAGIYYTTLSAPTTMVNALTSIPGSTAQYGYGYSEIERGKDGRLYFAYHPNYTTGYVVSGNIGLLYSIDPATGVVTAVNNGASQVSIKTVEENWSYIIQRQIDGENYNLSTHMAPTPSFNVAGITAPMSGGPADLYICNSALPINVTIPGVHTGYTVTLSTVGGFYDPMMGGWVYYYDLNQPSPNSYTITNTATNHTSNIVNYMSFLSSYTGYVMVTVTANGCGGNSSYSMVYNFKGSATTSTDYKAMKYNGGVTVSKGIQTTLPITTAMPVTTTNAAMQNAVDLLTGWVTANTTMGIREINTNSTGGSYTCKVYPAHDTTGNRLIKGGLPAPDIYRKTFSGAATNGSIKFNDETITFDETQPFFVDSSSGFADADWFRSYYKWAYDNGKLDSFSRQTYCVEVTMVTSTGCTESKKSYFKIANNGIALGRNARMTENGTLVEEISVYPNPAHDQFQVDIPSTATEAKMILTDMLGKTILSQDNIVGGRSFNIKHLPAGTYLYQIYVDGEIKRGKLIKQ